MSNLQSFLADHKGAEWSAHAFGQIEVAQELLRPISNQLTRSELAQALSMMLFDDLIQRVPVAKDYVADTTARGARIQFDHGAVRTVRGSCGELPPGEAAITRLLRALGYRHLGTYPLEKLKMTGRSWCHQDLPEQIAQYFISELHPERFSTDFQAAVGRVLCSSRDPLTASAMALLEDLDRDHGLTRAAAQVLMPSMLACFARQHAVFDLSDYEILVRESAEMAWIATEGNVFNHATDRVADVDVVAHHQRVKGRPVKDVVEVSRSGRVRQTAFRATVVTREFLQAGKLVRRLVPGSFYEFISRDTIEGEGRAKIDLQFDAGNATAIFAMTAVEEAT
jgi:hypothetical protein